MEKVCNRCGEIKTLSCFYKCKSCEDNVSNYCVLCASKTRKKFQEKNRESINKKNLEQYYLSYEKRKSYRESKKDYINQYVKEYKSKNKSKIREYQRGYERKNSHVVAWRNILKRTLKFLNENKTQSTEKYMGYTPVELKNHITSLFQNGMSWENYGLWHIDHKKPLSSFSKNTHPSVVNSLNNLQPLWAKDNLQKGCKVYL